MVYVLDSCLSKEGFIKQYSKPSNPGQAETYVGAPNYKLLRQKRLPFTHEDLAAGPSSHKKTGRMHGKTSMVGGLSHETISTFA